jgi:hypothetical protein
MTEKRGIGNVSDAVPRDNDEERQNGNAVNDFA